MMTFTRREFLRIAMGSAVAAAMPAFGRGETAAGRKPPNVLYLFSDMQRATSMGCYGDPNVRTPVLDAFARQGVRFDAAMSSTPVCCPHRAALMSGTYGHHNGTVSNSSTFKHPTKCLAEAFRDAGYATGYLGKWHIPGVKETDLGFQEVLTKGQAEKTGGHCFVVDGKKVFETTYSADLAIRFIQEKSAGAKPWLLMVSWVVPHTPYAATAEYRAHYPASKLKLPPNVPDGAPKQFALGALPDYYGMIENIDADVGRILDALQKAGAADDTVVCYSSDHGDMVGSHGTKNKRWPYEESARVPLLLRYPRAVKAGQVVQDPINTPDVYPTLCGLAGVKPGTGLDGADFSAFLTGQAARPPRDYAFLQMMYAYVPWPGWRALRTRQYMYARTKDGPWLLFDVLKDPYERTNLVEDKSAAALVKEMDDRLAAVMKETGDSWDLKAADGDLQNWLPGGAKQQQAYLGVPWPGCGVTGSGGGGGGGGKGRKGKNAPPADDGD
ncbi:MAG: sulfatase [Phycisphaerae bacterium]|nr:sulfatase [Phycisphaerae bacterium]